MDILVLIKRQTDIQINLERKCVAGKRHGEKTIPFKFLPFLRFALVGQMLFPPPRAHIDARLFSVFFPTTSYIKGLLFLGPGYSHLPLLCIRITTGLE